MPSLNSTGIWYPASSAKSASIPGHSGAAFLYLSEGTPRRGLIFEVEKTVAVSYIVFYEIGLGLAGVFTSAFFLALLSRNRHWDMKKIAYKFTAALTFLSFSILVQVLDETWEVLYWNSLRLPPINIYFEAIVISFLISGLWDIWLENA